MFFLVRAEQEMVDSQTALRWWIVKLLSALAHSRPHATRFSWYTGLMSISNQCSSHSSAMAEKKHELLFAIHDICLCAIIHTSSVDSRNVAFHHCSHLIVHKRDYAEGSLLQQCYCGYTVSTYQTLWEANSNTGAFRFLFGSRQTCLCHS